MKGRRFDSSLLYDPVQTFIDRQLGGRWPMPVFAMYTSDSGQQSSTPSTPMYHEDQLIEVIDRKYGGGYRYLLLYQYIDTGYTQQEIAEKMEVSLRTVERLIQRLKYDICEYREIGGAYHGKPSTKAEKKRRRKGKKGGEKGR